MAHRIQGTDEEDEFEELGDEQKVAIGKWFLLNAPPGQVLQVAKGILTAFRLVCYVEDLFMYRALDRCRAIPSMLAWSNVIPGGSLRNLILNS